MYNGYLNIFLAWNTEKNVTDRNMKMAIPSNSIYLYRETNAA